MSETQRLAPTPLSMAKPQLTASERVNKLATALRSIERFAGVCATTEIELKAETLRAALNDVALLAGRAAAEGEAASC